MVRLGMLAKMRSVAVLGAPASSGPGGIRRPLPANHKDWSGGPGDAAAGGLPSPGPRLGEAGKAQSPARRACAPARRGGLTCGLGGSGLPLPLLQLQPLLSHPAALLLDELVEGVVHVALIIGAGLLAAEVGGGPGIRPRLTQPCPSSHPLHRPRSWWPLPGCGGYLCPPARHPPAPAHLPVVLWGLGNMEDKVQWLGHV